MKANQARYPVRTMCRLLAISKSGYYVWLKRPQGPRAERDVILVEKIKKSHADSMGTYGMPRIHFDLQADGESVSRKRIARLMRICGLVGVSRRGAEQRAGEDQSGGHDGVSIAPKRGFGDGSFGETY